MRLLGCLVFLLSLSAHAYTIAVYTDETDPKKAQEVIAEFKKTYPFSALDITYNVVTIPSDELSCHRVPEVERNIQCDSANISLRAAALGIDQAFIVKEDPGYGGSGGSIPVITTKSPARTLLHEYLHTIGFSDVYPYETAEVANIYCKDNGGENVAFIDPNPAGYKNDGDARSQHMGAIPWSGSIAGSTLITHNNQTELGTDALATLSPEKVNNTGKRSELGSVVGLYEGNTCEKATPPRKSWQPGRYTSIMEVLDAGLGAGNEDSVMRILRSRGVALLNPPAESSGSSQSSSKSSSTISQ